MECVLARTQQGVAIDVGTGSGPIALALATEGHFISAVIATDVSRQALELPAQCRTALARAAAPVELRLGSLWGATPG